MSEATLQKQIERLRRKLERLENVTPRVQKNHTPPLRYVWEATADASSGTITAKRVNADGSLATPEKTFDVLPS